MSDLVKRAKNNWKCWQGVKETEPDLAEFIEKHSNEVVYYSAVQAAWIERLSESNPLMGTYVYRLRSDYVSDQPSGEWVEYPIDRDCGAYSVTVDDKYYHLFECLSMVAFGGVQFAQQEDDDWHMIIAAWVDCAGCLAWGTVGGNEKPAVPVRVRFWKGGE